MLKKLSYKYYNKQTITHDNGNVQSYDKEESKLTSTINDWNCINIKLTLNCVFIEL